MHAVMMENLEEFLSGSLGPAALREVETHLATCSAFAGKRSAPCRILSGMVGFAAGGRRYQTAPGFYFRVVRAGEPERDARTLVCGTVGGLDMVFGRRLVFASLVLILAVMGSYLVTHEAGVQVGPSPEAILAQQNAPAFETARAEDNMLVTLTAYEQ